MCIFRLSVLKGDFLMCIYRLSVLKGDFLMCIIGCLFLKVISSCVFQVICFSHVFLQVVCSLR